VWLKPGCLHVLPLLERYHHAEEVRCVCETPTGIWRLNKAEGERELLRVRSPSGQERVYVFHTNLWHELLSKQSQVPKSSEETTSELPKREVSKPEDEIDKIFEDKQPKLWVQRPDPQFGQILLSGEGRFRFDKLPHLYLYFDGRFQVGNEVFSLNEMIERDYYRTFIAAAAGQVKVWQCAPDKHDLQRWSVQDFRYYHGNWQRSVTGQPLDWIGQVRRIVAKFGSWVSRNGKRAVQWVDRKFFYD
jgi:hypothetical protein